MNMVISILTSTLLSMGTKLLTEKFVKLLIVKLLEIIVKRTQTDVDDKLLAEAKKSWGMEEEKSDG